MPQPLSQYGLLSSLHIGNNVDAPSRHRPQLALLSMQVMAEWSILEHWMGSLFLKMLGNNPGPAAAIYTSLTGAAAQRAAFRAVADEAITDQAEKDVFEGILSKFTSLAKERNKLAHWVWGHSDSIPDGVILCDPRVLMNMDVEQEVALQKIMNREKIIDFPSLHKDDIFVYKEIDFINMSHEIQKLMGYVQDFGFVLKRHVANKDGKLFQRLLDAPEIAEVVTRLRQRRKNDEEAQQPPPETPPSSAVQ